MRGNLVPVDHSPLDPSKFCFMRNAPNYNSDACQLVRRSGNEEALADYFPEKTPSWFNNPKNIQGVLLAIASGENNYKYNNGKFIKFKSYLGQNFEDDQMIFFIARLSGIVVPMVGVLGAFVDLWSRKILSESFKQRYIRLIQRDQNLVQIIQQVTGKRLENVNARFLQAIANSANRQVEYNRGAIRRNAIVQQYNRRNGNQPGMGAQNVERIIFETKVKLNERFVFIEMLTKTLAFFAICFKMLYYMMKVTIDLQEQSVISSDNLYLVIHLLARFLFIVKQCGSVSFQSLLSVVQKKIRNYLNINIPNYAIEPVEGLFSVALTRFTFDMGLTSFLMRNINDLKNLEGIINKANRDNIFVVAFKYVIGWVVQTGGSRPDDATIDFTIKMFRIVRDSFVKLSYITSSLMLSGMVAKLVQLSGGPRRRLPQAQPNIRELNQ